MCRKIINRLEIILWAFGGGLFICSRFFKDDFFGEGMVFGLTFFILGFWWFVIPFAMGRDISLPSFADTVFVKGKDDLIRWPFFILGLFMLLISLFVS